MKKHRETQKDIVIVQVNERRVRGKLTKIENNLATIQVPTYYRDGFIEVETNINDVERVKCDIGDYKTH